MKEFLNKFAQFLIDLQIEFSKKITISEMYDKIVFFEKDKPLAILVDFEKYRKLLPHSKELDELNNEVDFTKLAEKMLIAPEDVDDEEFMDKLAKHIKATVRKGIYEDTYKDSKKLNFMEQLTKTMRMLNKEREKQQTIESVKKGDLSVEAAFMLLSLKEEEVNNLLQKYEKEKTTNFSSWPLGAKGKLNRKEIYENAGDPKNLKNKVNNEKKGEKK